MAVPTPRIHWFLLLLGYLANHNFTQLGTNRRLLTVTKGRKTYRLPNRIFLRVFLGYANLEQIFG